MTEMIFSDTPLLSIFAQDLISLSSLITSHPLYFAYLLFFSPYILSLLSFLYPLILSTSLLLLSFITISPYLHNSASPPPGFIGKTGGIMINFFFSSPVLNPDNTIGLIEQLNDMVLAPIKHALVCNGGINGEIKDCMDESYDSSDFSCELETKDQEELFKEGSDDDSSSESEDLSIEMGLPTSKGESYNSSNLDFEIETKGENHLILKSGEEEKRIGNASLVNLVQTTNCLVDNVVKTRMSELYSSSLACVVESKDQAVLLSNGDDEMKSSTDSSSENSSSQSENFLESSGEIGMELKSLGELHNSCEMETTKDQKVLSLDSGIGEKSINQAIPENSIETENNLVNNCSPNSELYYTPSYETETKYRRLSFQYSKDLRKSYYTQNYYSPGETIGERLFKSKSVTQTEHARKPSEYLQREGSLRTEREWKRTLACKLYEERMTFKLCEERNVIKKEFKGEQEEEQEEMDLLWEAYEVNASNTSTNSNIKSKEIKKKGVREEEERGREAEMEEEREDEQEEEEEEGQVQQLCCLQALKISTRKMNLGVGKPNLVKLSKVLKRMSLFHGVSRRSVSKE